VLPVPAHVNAAVGLLSLFVQTDNMKCLKLFLAGLVLSFQLQCSNVNSGHSAENTNRTSETFTDYKTFILGTWDCDYSYNGVPSKMFVTFKSDNMIESDSTVNKESIEPYKFKNENTVQVSRYPDNLIIERVSDNQLRFKPEGDKLRKDLEIIYSCSFMRVAKEEK
jgi:hypothetical protein